DDPRLDTATERHKFALLSKTHAVQGEPGAALTADGSLRGLVIEMYVGWLGRDGLKLARTAMAAGRRGWLYWPEEQAVECVDAERAESLWRHWLFVTMLLRVVMPGHRAITRTIAAIKAIPRALRAWIKEQIPNEWLRRRRSRKIVGALLDLVK